jgi:hypothetical protein
MSQNQISALPEYPSIKMIETMVSLKVNGRMQKADGVQGESVFQDGSLIRK